MGLFQVSGFESLEVSLEGPSFEVLGLGLNTDTWIAVLFWPENLDPKPSALNSARGARSFRKHSESFPYLGFGVFRT